MEDQNQAGNLPATTDTGHQPATIVGPSRASGAQFMPEKGDEVLNGVDTAALKTAERSSLNIATQYYDFQLKTPIRVVYLGLTMAKTVNQQTGEEVELESAVFVDETNTIYVNAGVKLVTALAQLPAKTPVEITWTGTKKTGNGGQMRLFDVRVLRPAIKNKK